jgi:hypothetical protein
MKRSLVLAAILFSAPAFATAPTPIWWMGPGIYTNPAGKNPMTFLTKPGGHGNWVFKSAIPPVVVPPVTPPVTPPTTTPTAKAAPEQQAANNGKSRAEKWGPWIALAVFAYIVYVDTKCRNTPDCKPKDTTPQPWKGVTTGDGKSVMTGA